MYARLTDNELAELLNREPENERAQHEAALRWLDMWYRGAVGTPRA